MKRTSKRPSKRSDKRANHMSPASHVDLGELADQARKSAPMPHHASHAHPAPTSSSVASNSTSAPAPVVAPNADIPQGTLFMPASAFIDPQQSKAARRELHGSTLTGGVYHSLVHAAIIGIWGPDDSLSNSTCATSVLNAGDFLRRMQPRDAMEEMLLSQALWTHGRIILLTQAIAQECNIDLLERLSEIIERASNTFRRQLLALAEYRRPPAVRGPVTSIEQANIASQQIIVNRQEHTNENTTNEQGLPKWDAVRCPTSGAHKATLPLEPDRTCLTAGGCLVEATVGTVHRSKDEGG